MIATPPSSGRPISPALILLGVACLLLLAQLVRLRGTARACFGLDWP